jgi:hypothetical protein
MRRRLPPIVVAALAVGFLVSVGLAPAAMSDDREAKAAADVVNLNSAIVQERYAIHAVEQGTPESHKNALEALGNSSRALAAVDSTAADILYSDPMWMSDPEWSAIKTDVARAATYYEPRAMMYLREDHPSAQIVRWINGALEYKEKALAAAEALAKPPCTELLNLRGPFVVNGVAQGEPQLRISLACTQHIKSLKIDTPNETVDACTNPGLGCAIANGSRVTVQTGESKDPSVVLKGPALADGEEVIVEIKGDSIDYVVDEVM